MYTNIIDSDSDGIDPLTDIGLNSLMDVKLHTKFIVTEECEGRPDLISYTAYNTPDFWWVILGYNSISDVRDLIRGTKLRIPDYSIMITSLNKNAYRPVKSTVTKTII